jgi:hypothetical protein
MCILRTALTTICLVVGLLSTACGGDSPSTTTSISSGESYQLTSDQKSRANKEASEFEQSLLEDGVLTFDEYEQATFAAVECMKSAGFGIGPGDGPEVPENTEGPRLTSRGKYTYNPFSPPNFNKDEFIRIVTECKRRYSDVVDFFWAIKTAPTEVELQTMRASIGSCLRDTGHEVPEHPSSLDLARVMYPPDGKPAAGVGPPEFYLQCAQPVAEEHGLYGFLG